MTRRVTRPGRIQRLRTRGYKLPRDAVYVGRPTVWGNPFRIDSDWMAWAAAVIGYGEGYEGRRGAAIAFYRLWLTGVLIPGPHSALAGHKLIPIDDVRFSDDLTSFLFLHSKSLSAFCRDQVVRIAGEAPSLDTIRAELAGRRLACWCRLDSPCHADVLLEIANQVEAVAA